MASPSRAGRGSRVVRTRRRRGRGYLELEAEANGVVSIAFFGLVAEFVGKGYGDAFLTEETRLAS